MISENIIGNRDSIEVEKYALGFEIAQLQYKPQFGVDPLIVVDEAYFVIHKLKVIFPVFLGQPENAKIILYFRLGEYGMAVLVRFHGLSLVIISSPLLFDAGRPARKPNQHLLRDDKAPHNQRLRMG
ncbi:MAG: hypothetical protein WBB23_07890 [Desulforhopalus sp.]